MRIRTEAGENGQETGCYNSEPRVIEYRENKTEPPAARD